MDGCILEALRIADRPSSRSLSVWFLRVSSDVMAHNPSKCFLYELATTYALNETVKIRFNMQVFCQVIEWSAHLIYWVDFLPGKNYSLKKNINQCTFSTFLKKKEWKYSFCESNLPFFFLSWKLPNIFCLPKHKYPLGKAEKIYADDMEVAREPSFFFVICRYIYFCHTSDKYDFLKQFISTKKKRTLPDFWRKKRRKHAGKRSIEKKERLFFQNH